VLENGESTLTVEGEGESLDNLGFPERKDMPGLATRHIYSVLYTVYAVPEKNGSFPILNYPVSEVFRTGI
jgi:hypothetical protein